ncbi:MAG: hypothetical protein JW910_02395 [Anaerolineae bacterium]|nr:hypothetical protein [Anaerolineae bacterium]
MSLIDQSPVTDISPWPDGKGFAGGSTWWEYMISKEERRRLDNLMGLALLDQDVCQRLVKQRDDSLLSAFGLSEATRHWLQAIRARSLDELAQAIVTGP